MLALTIVALLIAAGCGSDAPAVETVTSSTSTSADAEPSDAEPTDAEPTDAEPSDAEPPIAIDQDSPVEALLGIPVFDDDAMNDWFRQLDIDRRRLTAECMIGEGFEYSLELPTDSSTLVTDLARSSREFAQTHGYGIVSAFNAAEYDPDKDYATKNSRYLETLSPAETDAYYVALYGATSQEELEDNESPFGVAGCEGASLEEVFSIVGVLDQIGPVADDYYDQILADSRSIALYDTWSECMAEAGFVFANPDDANESFYGRLDAILRNDAAFAAVEIPEIEQSDIVFSGDVFGIHPTLTNEAQAELDDLFDDEIATAVANWDCRAPLLDQETAIQREYEAKFVDEVGPQIAASLGDS